MGNRAFKRKINFNNHDYDNPNEGCQIGKFLYFGCEMLLTDNIPFMQFYDENHNAIYKIYEDQAEPYGSFFQYVKNDVLKNMTSNGFPNNIHYFCVISDVKYRDYNTPTVEVIFGYETDDNEYTFSDESFQKMLNKYRYYIVSKAQKCVMRAIEKGEIVRLK